MGLIYSDGWGDAVGSLIPLPLLAFHAQQFGALASGKEGFLGDAGGDREGFLVEDGANAKLLRGVPYSSNREASRLATRPG